MGSCIAQPSSKVLELHSNAHNPRATQADSIGAWRQIIPEWWTGWGWIGPLAIVQSDPSAQAGLPRVNCPRPCPNSFGIPLRWRLHFRQPVPVCGHPHRNRMLPDVEKEPHVLQSVPMDCHWTPSKRAWLPLLHTLQVFAHIYRFPESSSGWTTSALITSFYTKYSPVT